ncbi:hypothetical protein PHYPSEUDO_007128 [Phytophthora pseudosyringae]|uniref:FYVE-type domain-containing protein n=1 Tax=Phytophthora pseudosyringae TaxID=221518 RepID=A0A8T1WBE7_9STRA|nr:hypothetical protein PHYPSEUDO_007128 [Phytophthora pseudosyringae]
MPPSPSSASSAARINAELAADAKPSMGFPLPAGYFGDVQVSASKRQEYSDIVRRRVNSMLADEHRSLERRGQQQPAIREAEWKLFRRVGGLRVYQRRLRGRSRQEVAAEEEAPEAAIAVERGNPGMLADGSVTGTIEDMLYGMSATTQEEMLTGLALTAPPQDAVLLSVVERSTVDDPLRSEELLWVLTKMPVLNPRDVCYLKATGVGTDGNGRPYGYVVLHSVDVPECPPFDYRKTKVHRAKVFFSFLLRESSPGSVDVMGRGVFDLAGGGLLKLVLPHATTSVMDGLVRGASCGEAKKLTLLALRSHDERRLFKSFTKKSVCSMCIRGNKSLLSGVRLKSCEVCGVPICRSCKIKDRRMFTGTRQPCRDVVCCASCSQQAKCIAGVRLGEPEFVVVAEYYSKGRSTSSCSASGRSAVARSTPSLEASARQAQQHPVAPAGKAAPTSLLSDAGEIASSVAVTNSTIGDSCAGFDFDVSFCGTLSDRNSGEYRLNPKDADDLYEEPEPVSAEWLKEYAELGDVAEETSSSRMNAWNDNYRVDAHAFAKSPPPADEYGSWSSSKRRPDNMLEWMRELQSSAEEAYSTAMANEAIMKKSMR